MSEGSTPAQFVPHDVQRAGRPIGAIVRPTSTDDALDALASVTGARPLAGGTDLLLDLQRGESGPPITLVDLTGIESFGDISDQDDHWRLGGGCRHNQVVAHHDLRQSALPLAQACLEIGSPQLRNRATIAGNIASASPANDSISALIALAASVEIASLIDGQIATRVVPAADFFTGFRQTVLGQAELITAILVPKMQEGERGIWVKLGLRRAQAISVVHAGMVVGLDSDNVVATARLALGSVAPTIGLSEAFSTGLVGSTLDPTSIADVARQVSNEVEPITDGRATDQYRHAGVAVLIERALHALAAGDHAAMWPTAPPTLSNSAALSQSAPNAGDRVDASTAISMSVNGDTVTGAGATTSLLDWVRHAGLTGIKEGCGEGECGACTMLVDGDAVMSCLVTAGQVAGCSVTTVEGLADTTGLHPIQASFVEDFAVQCGFCIPGFLMAGSRLLEETPEPTDEQIHLGLSGNLCRCTGYYPIIQAIKDAAVTIRGSHG